jgi:putative sigma-54 modulation protein
MQLKISGHQIEVTSALRDYVGSKFERISRHFENVLDIHVILSVEKLIHRAEATVKVSQKTIHADSESEDMYAAIDLLSDKLDRQIKQHKEKLTDHHRADARKLRQTS